MIFSFNFLQSHVLHHYVCSPLPQTRHFIKHANYQLSLGFNEPSSAKYVVIIQGKKVIDRWDEHHFAIVKSFTMCLDEEKSEKI